MKPHTLHRLYKAIMFVVLTGIVIFVYRTNPDFLKAPKAESSTAQNVSGFAWSGGADANPGIGWISFNDTSDASAPPAYGVNVDTATGDFSGTAWSEHIGWISFDRTATNNPPLAPFNGGVGAIAKVNTSTGVVTGWARAISGCEEVPGVPVATCASSNAGAAAGGWDGWIRLSGTATDGSPYGVSIMNNGSFSNDVNAYAWGGDAVGWVDFSPELAGSNIVHVNFPACTIANVTSWGSCNEQADFCSSNSPGTDIPGTRLGTCGFGYSGSATQTCDPGTYCPLPAAVNGNGICEPGETMLNAPSDCRGKVQQF